MYADCYHLVKVVSFSPAQKCTYVIAIFGEQFQVFQNRILRTYLVAETF